MATTRTLEGRLFPARKFPGGWSISIQADKVGYACHPRRTLETIEEYDAVEVALYGPFPHVVDVTTLGLPLSITSKFHDIEKGQPCIGANLSWSEVALLEAAVLAAALEPWAGIPKGRVGWSEAEMYLGCDEDLSRDLLQLGPPVLAGRTTRLFLDQGSAVSEGSEILRVDVREEPRVLDLRNAHDREFWSKSGLSESDDIRRSARDLGIDGIFMPDDGCLMLLSPTMLCDRVWSIVSTPAGLNP